MKYLPNYLPDKTDWLKIMVDNKEFLILPHDLVTPYLCTAICEDQQGIVTVLDSNNEKLFGHYYEPLRFDEGPGDVWGNGID